MSGQRDAHRRHRDSDDWATADEPMTDSQESLLEELCGRAGRSMDYFLTKAQASRRIEDLKLELSGGARREPLPRRPRD